MKFLMTKRRVGKAGQAKADRVRRFIEERCTYSKGEWAGQSFVLLPWQWDKLIRPLFGTLNGEGLRQYRTCYVEIPKKNGKALDLETPIPTPNGWTTMRDVQPGDFLFDDLGAQCQVVAVSPVAYGRPCFEVVFGDGERIVTDAEHKWRVTSMVDKRRSGVRTHYMEMELTTEQMSHSLTSHGGQCKTYKVRVAGPVQCATLPLPIPPYTLGAWLGDGNSRNSGLTCCDPEILQGIANEGVNLLPWKNGENRAPTYGIGKGQGIQTRLRSLGVLGSKRIPVIYLRGSHSQRLALLRGLMDTDGYCSERGQCEFTTTTPALRDGFIELTRSLGYKPTSLTGTARANGKAYGEKYRISFFAFKGDEIFSVSRKAAAQKARAKNPTRSQFRQIVDIRPVPSRPVKCIAVDSPSNLYLCGRGFIPTHNTELCAAIALYMLVGDGEAGPECYVAASDREQAGLTYQAASAMVRANPTLSAHLKCLDSRKRIIYPKKNGFLQVLSSESYTKHGLSPSCVIIDEIHAHPDDELWNVLTAGTDYARRQQVVLVITTAGIYDKNSIWWRLRSKAQQVQAGLVEDPRFLPVLYLADPEKDDPADEKLWVRVNPSLGQIFTLDKIRQDYQEAKQDPVDFQNFLRFRLNIPIRQLSRWMPMDAWDKCARPVDTDSLKGRLCYGGLDLSSKLDLSAFVLVFPPVTEGEPHDVLCRFYCPEDGIMKRSRTDKVRYDLWAQHGHLTPTAGNVIDHEFIKRDVFQAAKDYRLARIDFDSFDATQIASDIMAQLNPTNNENGFQMVEFRQGVKSFNEPAKDLLVHVMKEDLRHGGQPVLRWCADNLVMRQDANANVAPDKEHATDKIDGLVALIMAWRGAMSRQGPVASVYEQRGVIVL